MRVIVLLSLFIAVCLFPDASSRAQSDKAVEGFRSTELPLPRFVSLRSEKVYVRAGPALRYPIKWVYRRDKLPVEIIQEFENWRKIRGYDDDEGWIHQSLLSGARTVIVRAAEPVPMREGFTEKAKMIARVEPDVVATLDQCSDAWCRIEARGYEGWVQRKNLWGVYEDEELD